MRYLIGNSSSSIESASRAKVLLVSGGAAFVVSD